MDEVEDFANDLHACIFPNRWRVRKAGESSHKKSVFAQKLILLVSAAFAFSFLLSKRRKWSLYVDFCNFFFFSSLACLSVAKVIFKCDVHNGYKSVKKSLEISNYILCCNWLKWFCESYQIPLHMMPCELHIVASFHYSKNTTLDDSQPHSFD